MADGHAGRGAAAAESHYVPGPSLVPGTFGTRPRPDRALSEGTAADMRSRILARATELFVAHGYHALSMREIAEAVGISKPGLYYHFRDKEDLFLAILQVNLERVGQIVQAAAERGGTLQEQVTWMLRAILTLPACERAIIRLVSQEMGHLSEASRADFAQMYREKFIGRIEALLQTGIARGELRPVDPGLATWLLLGMAYPFFYPGPPQPADMNEVVDLMVTVFFDGLAARGMK
ncbi:MAG: TetR/AcrR family transcriptional regulator [Anaerolineae bacterium]